MGNNRFDSFEVMCKWIFITCLLFHINGFDQCAGDSHLITGLYTNFGDNWDNGFTLLDEVLFVRNSISPKSYVVGFKYVGDAFSRIIYSGTIHSDAQNTNGGGDLSNGAGIHDNHYLNANIHIPNATNFRVGMTIRGLSGAGYSGLERFLRLKIFRPRSSALICAINKSQPHTKYRKLIFGERKTNDFILYARKIFTPADKEMPRHKIEFQDDNAIITAVEIRLNSTKAIVFHNKVQLTEHRFSGTIYGVNRDTIADVVIIYGYQT